MIEALWNGYISLWGRAKGRGRFAFYTVHYTALFFLLSFFVFAAFREAGVSLMWYSDGRAQHFARLLYLSKTFREGVRALLAGEGWTIPMYDFRNGLTAVDLQIGFPQILAVFFPPEKVDVFYNILVLSGYYMSGLSFSALGFYFRRRPLAVLTGAVSYAFCGFILFTGVRHPHFVVAMWFLPLLIIGAEKVLKKETGWLLLVMVFLSVTTQWGLYFSCMQAVLVVLYVTVRFFDLCRTDRLKEYVRLWGRLCIWGGTGALLAGVVLVPSFFAIIGTGRVGRGVSAFRSLLHYDKAYYISFLNDFMISPSVVGDWTILGFSSLSVPSVLWLYTRRGKPYRTLRVLFAALTLMLCIPAVGYTLSGLSNVSNRFCFAYALCVSAIVMFMFPESGELSIRDLILPCLWLAAYAALPFITRKPISGFRYALFAYALIPGIMVLGWLTGKAGRKLLRPALLLAVCLGVCLSGTLRFSPLFENYVAEFISSPYELSRREQYAALSESETIAADKDFYRVAGSNVAYQELNMAFYYDLNGITMYPYFGWSEDYLNWLREMEFTFNTNRQQIYGLNSNARLLTLSGTKYYAYREGKGAPVPYGFDYIDAVETSGKTEQILVNTNWLPLGYTYNRYFTREDASSLNALDLQETMMNSVLLENDPEGVTIEKGTATDEAIFVPSSVESTDELTWEDGVLTVNKAGATLTLSFDGLPETETWLQIKDLQLKSGYWSLTAQSDDLMKCRADFASDAFVYSNGQHTQLLPFGYSQNARKSIRITFPRKGTFKLKALEVWCQPVKGLADSANALRQEQLEEITTNWRGLTGSINVQHDKILCLSIPWLDGWAAYLDGQRVKLQHANTAFMAVEIPAGEHTLELRYTLPGLLPGAGMSIVGLLLTVWLACTSRKRRSKQD